MIEGSAGTSGGGSGTGGPRWQRLAWVAAGALLYILVESFASVESTIEDMAELGRAETRAHVWTWQLSSVVTWLALAPLIWWLAARLRPPRVAWPAAALLHLAATVPVSLVHSLTMVGVRKAVYALWGETYRFGNWPMELLYEYRKDLPSYLIVLAFVAWGQWLLARPDPLPPPPEALLIPDGSATHRVPIAEIDWATAAGNYVEIAWGPRTLLHRSTLAALADQLGPGFVRIHRGRLVRRGAVRSIATDRSGDFTVTLASGAELRGSRRYRAGL